MSAPAEPPAGSPPRWARLSWTPLAPARNGLKAAVSRATEGTLDVVCKDRSGALRRWFAPYVRWIQRNEVRALAAFGGIEGVPRLLDHWGTGLVMEQVPGAPLGSFGRGSVDDAVFDRIEGIMHDIHARGHTVGDLHRSNILLDHDGSVHLIDFEASVPVDRGLARPFRRTLLAVDRYGAARLRRKYGATLHDDHRSALARGAIPRINQISHAIKGRLHARERRRRGRAIGT